MTCQELERFLHPYLDGEFGPEERLEVEGHLSQCSACAQRVHAEASLQQLVRRVSREHSDAVRAPAQLRLTLQEGLHRELRKSQARIWMRAGMAAAVVAAASGSWWALQPASRERFVEDAARRHAKRLPFEIAQASHEGVEAWFGGKLDHRVAVPYLRNTVLAGARLSNVKDRPAAYISYEAPPRPGAERPRRIGLFVFDDAHRDIQAQALPAVQVDSSNGFNVAVWREGELVYELVSDLDANDIRQMLASPEQRPALVTPGPTRSAPLTVQPVSLQP